MSDSIMDHTSQPSTIPTNDGGNGFFTGLVIGAIVGGFAAYLLSSEEGKEKAKKLLEKSEGLLDAAEEKAGEVKDALTEQVRDALTEEDEQDDIVEAVSQIRRRFFKKNGKKLNPF